jgi:hypothetical protein
MDHQVQKNSKQLFRCPDELRFIEPRMGRTLQMRRSNALIVNGDGVTASGVAEKRGRDVRDSRSCARLGVSPCLAALGLLFELLCERSAL